MREVQKEYVNIKIPANSLRQPGYALEQKPKPTRIKLFIYKGNSISRQEHILLNRLIMVRLKIKFIGNLKAYVPMDSLITREVIQSADVDFNLIDMFFRRKHNKWRCLKLLGPIREKYFGVQVGEYIGTVFMDFDEFRQFTDFIRYLLYEPLRKGEDVL